MAMSGNVFLILMIASCGNSQSLLYSSPIRSSQGFQRKSLEDYYDPPLRFPRRQHVFGNEVNDRCLVHYNGEGDINNEYIYGVKRNPRLEYSRGRPITKRNYGYGRERRFKEPVPLDLFIRPQDPRRGNSLDYTPNFNFNFNLRATYDVLQVECPRAKNGRPRIACPSSDRTGRFRCITEHHLCDGFIDCPLAEDEDRQYCMFYKMTKTQVNFIADVLLRLAHRNLKHHPI